jgi:dCMP deaminase
MKINKIKFYLNLAKEVATESTCPRAQVGSVLVNDDRVISLGYNGAPRGIPHCKEDGCWLRRKGNKLSCALAVHSEINAVINAAYGGASTKNSMLFCTHKPCIDCTKLLINAGVGQVFYINHYADKLADKLVSYNRITLVRMSYAKRRARR